MDEQREAAFWPWFMTLGGGCGVVGYFVAHDDHITAIVALLVALSALSGYCLMASRIVCGNCGLVAAALATWILWRYGQSTLQPWLGTSGAVLGIGLTGLLVALATTVGLRRFVVNRCSERPGLEVYNRWTGFGLGAGQGVILCLVVFGGLLVVEPIAVDRVASDIQLRDHRIARVLATKAIEYAGETRDSSIGKAVAHYNPWRHLDPLEEFGDDLRNLRHPWTKAPSKTDRAVDEQFSAR